LRRLASEISRGETRFTETNSELATVNQQLEWARDVQPQEVPTRTARGETGLSAISGVALLETRRREANDVWVPVDHGMI